MSIRRAGCWNGRIMLLAIFLVMMTLGPVHAGLAFLPSQYLTMCVAIDGVLPAAGEIIDCNENGIDDAQDIADMTSADCNTNGIPDECEINENSIAPGGPFFCTDQCDSDCNHSGVPDECELAGNDDNGDGIPDECGVFILCAAREDQKLTASDAAMFDRFGRSVSISGDTVVIGADLADCEAASNCGAAYVYRFDGTNWIEQQKLAASDSVAQDLFGGSVSISGNTAIVGAVADNCAAGQDCGAAYIYRFDGTNWIEQQKLNASDGAANDAFGGSVSISGDTTIVGAAEDDCAAGEDCGASYVYHFDGTNWIERQKLTASDAARRNFFGRSVSISGDTSVVMGGGSAYVFRYNGTNWIEEQKLTVGVSLPRRVVSIGGNIFVVGDQWDDCTAGGNCGAAYVFRYDGANWIEEQKLTASDAGPGDKFGTSVAIGGSIAVVGAIQNCAAGSDCGSAYVYRFDGTNWIEELKLTALEAAADDEFGGSVAISGDTVIVGAEREGGRGAAYSFDLTGEELPDSDADGVADECDICPGGDDTLDTDGDGVPDDCDACDNNLPETCTFSSPILAPPPHDILKNRYISIDPRGEDGINTGLTFDIRVELVSSLVNGQIGSGPWWAGPPWQYGTCISIVTTTQPTTPLIWDACPILHLTGCPIIPTSTYDISVVIGGLPSDPPLIAPTQAKPGDSWHGDCVGHFDGSKWTAPNGAANIDDALAAIKTFIDPNAVNAAHVSVTDVHPQFFGGPHNNRGTSINDVLTIILGFQGREYPEPDLTLCP